MIDFRNQGQRKQLTEMLREGVRQILQEEDQNTQEQSRIKFDVAKYQKQIEQYNQQRLIRNTSQENIQSKVVQTKGPSQSQLTNLINYQNQKQNLLKQQREAIEEHLMKEMEEVTFHPQISKYASQKFKNGKNKCYTELYDTGIQWMKEKAQNLEQQKEEYLTKINQENSFKPKINKKSSEFQIGQKDFYTRMQENEEKKQLKKSKIQRDYTPTFKPKINKKSQHLKSDLSINQLNSSVSYAISDQIKQFNNKINKESQLNYLSKKNKEKQEDNNKQQLSNLVSGMKLKKSENVRSKSMLKYNDQLQIQEDMVNKSCIEECKDLTFGQNVIMQTIKKQPQPMQPLFSYANNGQCELSEMMYDFLAE